MLNINIALNKEVEASQSIASIIGDKRWIWSLCLATNDANNGTEIITNKVLQGQFKRLSKDFKYGSVIVTF
jgi:hypothetical protein